MSSDGPTSIEDAIGLIEGLDAYDVPDEGQPYDGWELAIDQVLHILRGLQPKHDLPNPERSGEG